MAHALPLLALSRHSDRGTQCPLSGVKRTSVPHRKMSANNPKRTCFGVAQSSRSNLECLPRPATESLLAPGEVTLAWICRPIGCPAPAPNRQDHQQKGNDNQYGSQQQWTYLRMAGSGARAAQEDDRTALAPPNSNAPPLVESAVQGWWHVPMTRYDPR